MSNLRTFFTSSFSAVTNPTVLGLTLHRAWIATFFFSANIFVGADPSNTYVGQIYSISLLSLACILVAGGLAPNATKRLMDLRFMRIAAPTLLSIGSLSMLLVSSPDASALLPVSAGVLTGVGSGFLLLYWGELYGSSEPTTAQIHSALAFMLAAFIYALFLLLSSSMLYILVSAILPLLSGIALAKARKADTGVPHETHAIVQGERSMLQVAAAALIISFVHAGLMVVTRNLPQEASSTVSFIAFEMTYTLTLLVSTIIIALLIFVTIFLSKKSDMGLIYRFVLLFLIIGVLFSPFAGTIGTLSTIIVNAGYTCFELIFWIALSNISFRYHISPIRVFGLGRAGWVFGVFLGGLYPPLPFVGIAPLSPLTSAFFMISVLIVCTVVTYTFILPERTIVAITTGYGGRRGSLQSRCQKLSKQFGLSQRENEVLACIVRGRDTSYIQQTLNISAGTVSTHRMRIYQKIGVHSRQELLDMLEQVHSDEPVLPKL
ncbi:MAG: helix-turn-helix transcriptional regulator [Coriobacteriales bacterium]|jgi:DNA-binding CsgD family transcriptional regulator|nr:helix-turn-helix transcriptional regulator [Coriobacteriales bacterium]